MHTFFAATTASKQHKSYAGVVVFCVPYVLESGRNTRSVDATGFQVCSVIDVNCKLRMYM